MKTVFITAFHSYVSRNILNTEVFMKILLNENIRTIIFVHNIKKNYFESVYGAPNVFIESVDSNILANISPHRFFNRISKFMLKSKYLKYKRVEKLNKNKNILSIFKYIIENITVKILGSSKIFQYIFRYLYITFGYKGVLTNYFEKYNPDLVFSTDIFDTVDTIFLQEAKKKHITTVGMIRSWDNCYSKGLLKVIPDSVIVNNNIIKEEAMIIHNVPEDRIFIGGFPQFDRFVKENRKTRGEFFQDMGIDTRKKLITFAPAGKRLSDTDVDICRILKDSIDSGKIDFPVHILVRNHPNHPAELFEFEGYDNFTIETPGLVFNENNRKETEITKEGSAHLADTLYNSDLIIWVATTLGIDALVFDKPQISINFDGFKNKKYYSSVKRYHDEDHMKKMLDVGGVSIAENQKDLIDFINMYLEKPQTNIEKRKLVKNQQIYKTDGKSGERIGDFILKQLGEL